VFIDNYKKKTIDIMVFSSNCMRVKGFWVKPHPTSSFIQIQVQIILILLQI